MVLIGLWEVFSRAGMLPMDSFSRPSLIARRGLLALADGSLLVSTWYTLEAALAGLVIAAVPGIVVGAILGLAPRLDRVVGPTIDALRPVPAVALIPLALLVFGFGLSMEASVVAFAGFWPILIVTTAAVRGIEPRLLDLSRALELPFGMRLRKIILPAALGRILVGLRVAVGISLVVAVTVEIVLNPRGLGYGMILAQQALQSDLMYAQLLWLGLVGWALNFSLTKAVSRWPGAAA